VSRHDALLQLHDADVMIAEFEDTLRAGRLRRLGFRLEGLEEVSRRRARLTARIDARWIAPYERARGRYGRGLVAVRDRVCQGCFITLPTSATPPVGDTLSVCESCGRILYWR
jgi:predicted  nucleic acid-binding Zn-ribbon protein